MLKLLPFTALRTMEAVIRLRGFGRAAEELNVTQSAVSQHIKSLEEWSGQKLLVRGPRSATPTEAGLRLAAAVTEGFTIIEEACEALRGRSAPDPGLLVAAPPGFAFIWLLPRLIQFDEANQNIPISLTTDSMAREVSNVDTDVIIHYGTGNIPGMHTELLLRETMAPVCTPQIAAQLDSIGDLAKFTALIDAPAYASHEPIWEFWAREVNVSLPKFERKRSFMQANMVVQAAIEGLGVAMGRSALVADALAQGKLVHPFELHAVSQLSYWVVCRRDAMQSPSVQAFHEWLIAEASKTQSTSD